MNFPECWTQQDIISTRGWSLAMVKTLLGEPDYRAPNTRYMWGHELKLYEQDRVLGVERTSLFADRLARKRAWSSTHQRRGSPPRALAVAPSSQVAAVSANPDIVPTSCRAL